VPNGHTTAFGALDPLEFGRRSSRRHRLGTRPAVRLRVV